MKKLIITAGLSLVMLAGCQNQSMQNVTIDNGVQTGTVDSSNQNANSTDGKIVLDESFTLMPDQVANFNDSSIKFIALESDSRCAEDVQCIWQGEATLNLEINGFKPAQDNINKYSITTLHKTLDLGMGDTAYVLELIDVVPHPKSTIRIDPSKYQATFKLSKKQ